MAGFPTEDSSGFLKGRGADRREHDWAETRVTILANLGQTPAENDREENEREGQTQQGIQHKPQGPIGLNTPTHKTWVMRR